MPLEYESRQAFAARSSTGVHAAPRWLGLAVYGALTAFGGLLLVGAPFDADGDVGLLVALGIVFAAPCGVRFVFLAREALVHRKQSRRAKHG